MILEFPAAAAAGAAVGIICSLGSDPFLLCKSKVRGGTSLYFGDCSVFSVQDESSRWDSFNY